MKKKYGSRGRAHVRQSGADSWRVTFSLNGQRFRRRYASAGAASEAEGRANHVLSGLREGLIRLPQGGDDGLKDFVFSGGTITPRDPQAAPFGETVSDLMDRYELALETAQKESTSKRTERVHLRTFRRWLKEAAYERQPVGAITAQVLRGYQAWRLERVGSVTINLETVTIRNVFALCGDEPNPVKGLKRYPTNVLPEFRTGVEIARLLMEGVYDEEQTKAVRRARILMPPEVDELIGRAESRTVFVPLCVAAFTGARRGEIVMVTWAHADLAKREITFHSKKQSASKKTVPRTVRINDRLLPVLREHKLKTGGLGYLFPGRKDGHLAADSLRDNLGRLINGTQYDGVGWHTFRHSFVTHLARAGVSRDVIKKMVGHVSDAMFDRYRHVLPDEQEDAMEALEAYNKRMQA